MNWERVAFANILRSIYSLLMGKDEVSYERRLERTDERLLDASVEGLGRTYWREISQMRTIMARDMKYKARCLELQDFIIDFFLKPIATC